MPDGRIAVTSDVDRPWMIDRKTLRVSSPLGRRNEWLPMFSGAAGDTMGNLFAGYNNSHVIYTDHNTNEVFIANFQFKQTDGSHPVKLVRWNGKADFENWIVVDQENNQIEIKQSIHELIFTKDYILMADTAFAAGTEMLMPWKNAPLPNEKTVVYIVDRRDLENEKKTVRSKRIEVDEACIHLLAEYDNPDDMIKVYMMHTPATNTAELLHDNDKDLNGNLFPKHLIGYGTLPVLDLSSIGKHVLDVKNEKVKHSEFISEMPFTWGPYLYAYMGRQIKPYNGQDIFVMFKGFNKSVLPKRIYKAYKDVDERRVDIDEMVSGEGIEHNNSLCRVSTGEFKITDSYVLPEKTLLYTIACVDGKGDSPGYVIAGVATDDFDKQQSSGHEYWIFAADNLSAGPVCKMGHKELNNSTLFHTVYIPKDKENQWENDEEQYNIDLRKDYPAEELTKWEAPVADAFEDVIWNYFDKDPEKAKDADKKAKFLASQRIKRHEGFEHIIGEEKVANGAEFAEKMVEEVERMWQTSGWKEVYDKNNLLVESKPVVGVFKESGVMVTRAFGKVNANAQATFDMLVSPEGYAVIDPVSKPEDHDLPPLETYAWREGSRLEAAIAQTNIAMLPSTEFVVLNAVDPKERIFVSKSILHDNHPGGSKYCGVQTEKGKPVRALNTFAIRIEEISDEACMISCINYADMCGKTNAFMNNLINEKFFLPPLFKRIRKRME